MVEGEDMTVQALPSLVGVCISQSDVENRVGLGADNL